jgi:hypothetical protein
VAVLTEQTLDAVLVAPSEGYVPDQPDSDDGDTVANSAFEDEDGWYDYDEETNRLSPRQNVYVVQTARGVFYKLALLDYYDEAGSSGHPSFSWAELGAGDAITPKKAKWTQSLEAAEVQFVGRCPSCIGG